MTAWSRTGARCTQRIQRPMTPVLWALLAVAMLAAALAAGCAKPAADPTKLQIEDIKVGTGAEAKDGDLVTVHYTGWLMDGTKFDSSVASGRPFPFRLGEGSVIKGWDQGVAGMKVGGKRKLTIPPDLGYGAQGAGGAIPPNATLVFDVELVSVN